jgi:hypothetical protein
VWIWPFGLRRRTERRVKPSTVPFAFDVLADPESKAGLSASSAADGLVLPGLPGSALAGGPCAFELFGHRSLDGLDQGVELLLGKQLR